MWLWMGVDMNKMLIVIFDNETAAKVGLEALRKLHKDGDITLYATGVMVRDAQDKTRVLTIKDQARGGGAGIGLAVGSVIGLLGGPVGVAIGAVTGTAVGAIRDLWVAGVGLDFIEEAKSFLQPGKVALVAEVEEEWVSPANAAMAACGGRVLRRIRTDLADGQFHHDIGALKTELNQLEQEATHAHEAAKSALETELSKAKASMDGLVDRAGRWVTSLMTEADDKADLLKQQWSKAPGDVKARLEARRQRVTEAYHARSRKLAMAWELTKEALTRR